MIYFYFKKKKNYKLNKEKSILNTFALVDSIY